jgi:hypothetical protein
VRRRRQRCAGAAPGADRHRGLDRDRRRQIGRRHGADRARPAGIVAAVKEGRTTFQRIQTYTLNSITKKIVQVLFLMAGLMMTGQAILTPLLMVIIMITGDFLGMSLTTDNVRALARAERVAYRQLTIAGASWAWRAGLLLRRAGGRRLRRWASASSAENAGLRGHRLRQAGHDLHQSRTPLVVVVAPERLADRVVHRRCGDRLAPLGISPLGPVRLVDKSGKAADLRQAPMASGLAAPSNRLRRVDSYAKDLVVIHQP